MDGDRRLPFLTRTKDVAVICYPSDLCRLLAGLERCVWHVHRHCGGSREGGGAPGRRHSLSRFGKNGTRVQLSTLQRGECKSFDLSSHEEVFAHRFRDHTEHAQAPATPIKPTARQRSIQQSKYQLQEAIPHHTETASQPQATRCTTPCRTRSAPIGANLQVTEEVRRVSMNTRNG